MSTGKIVILTFEKITRISCIIHVSILHMEVAYELFLHVEIYLVYVELLVV